MYMSCQCVVLEHWQNDEAKSVAKGTFAQSNGPNHVKLIEVWEDPKTLATHKDAIETKQFRAAILPISGSLYDERVFAAL